MTEVVSLLEALGRGPKTPHDALESLVVGLDPVACAALVQRNQPALVQAVGGRATIACAISLPDNDEPYSDEPGQQDDDLPGEPEVRAA